METKPIQLLLFACAVVVVQAAPCAAASPWSATSPWVKQKSTSSPFSAQQNVAQNPRGEFDEQVKVGADLVRRAEDILKERQADDAMKVAVGLYAQAGQLFEHAAIGYQALGPQGATPADVENAQKAVQYCIQSIQEIKKHFRGV
jgi:hypothetical protein